VLPALELDGAAVTLALADGMPLTALLAVTLGVTLAEATAVTSALALAVGTDGTTLAELCATGALLAAGTALDVEGVGGGTGAELGPLLFGSFPPLGALHAKAPSDDVTRAVRRARPRQ